MKSIQLAWRPGTSRFEATGHSGARITFEAPGEPDEVPLVGGPHGSAAGPSPAELLLVAGAGCAAWDLVEILRKQHQDVATIDIDVDGDQQPDPPWTFRRVELRFTVAAETWTATESNGRWNSQWSAPAPCSRRSAKRRLSRTRPSSRTSRVPARPDA